MGWVLGLGLGFGLGLVLGFGLGVVRIRAWWIACVDRRAAARG